MSKKASKGSFLKKIFLTNFLDMLGFGMVLPVFGFLFEEVAIDGQGGIFAALYSSEELKFLYLLMVGSYSIGTWLGAPVIGALSDKFGRKRMLQFTYTCNILFYLVFVAGILNVSYPLTYLGRVLAGLTGGSLLVINASIADVSAPEDKAKNFGITGIAFGLGAIIGSLLGGFLSDPSNSPYFNEAVPVLVSCCVTFVNILFMTFVFDETFEGIKSRKVSILTGPKNTWKAFSNKSLRDIFIVIFLMTLAFNFLLQFYQFYARDTFGFSKTEIGLLLAFVGVSIAIAQGLLLRWVSNRYDPIKVMAVGLPLFACSYLLLLVPETWMPFCAMTFFMASCQGVTFPTSLSVVSNLADHTVQGETIGINMSVQSFAAATPILIGLITEIQYSFPMWFGACLTLVAWLYFLLRFWSKLKPNS